MSVSVAEKRVVEVAETRAALRAGRVRRLRIKLGLSQRELAEAVGGGVDAATISRWENGVRVPRTAAAARLAAVLRALEAALQSASPAVAGDSATRDQLTDANGTPPR